MLVHITSSSLLHVFKATSMLLYLQRETSDSQSNKTQDQTHSGVSPSSVLSTQSTVEGQKNTCKQHALTREHTPTKKELQYTHLTRTHSQSHISWQILIQPHERMHQSPAFFPPSSTKIPLSHRSNRYVYSTHRISLTARLAHATLILER